MNYSLLLEAFIMGLLTYVIGIIIFNLTINKKNKYSSKPFGINIAFFATGFFLFIISEILNSNQNIFF